MRFFAAPSLCSGLRLRMTGSEGLAMTGKTFSVLSTNLLITKTRKSKIVLK